jgi:D-alanyl-D-alanine carboxypeptidase
MDDGGQTKEAYTLVMRMRLVWIPLLAVLSSCAGDPANTELEVGVQAEVPGDLGTSISPLTANDPVSAAAGGSCTTASVKGLATQLVAEIQCLRPGTLKSIAGISGISLGSAVFPYLQTSAANALVAAKSTRTATLSVNSALRTLPQQYLLYRWYRTGRCNIGLAATPGTSNHEAALAVDIEDSAAWRTALRGKQFRWLGASDDVHYDYIGAGSVDIRGLSVKAFQRLWNRNHPEDKIAEDGAYGDTTETRLAKSPIGGFAKGALCPGDGGTVQNDSGSGSDAGPSDELPPYVPPETPDAPESPSLTQCEPSGGCCALASKNGTHGAFFASIALLLCAAARRRAVAT